ncbi:MAG: sterol desaturase family protein [Planctomycetes bacterium]|nr:sterol desaturase family protein [Planctomycetota bacterium]
MNSTALDLPRSTERPRLSWLVSASYPALLLGGCALLAWALHAELAAAGVLVAVYVIASAGIVALLERVAPASPPTVSGREVRADALHVVFSTVLPTQLVGVLITAAGLGASAASFGWLSETLGLSLWPHSLPLVLQLGLAMLIGELGVYVLHRTCHVVPLFWRIHAVHHTPEQLYIVAAGRNHPIQAVLNYSLQTLPIVVLGADPAVIALYAAFTGVNGLFQHANLHVRARFLSLFVATPALHRTHHSRDAIEGNRNFGNNLILWDWVFGTRHIAPEPEAFGIDDKEFPVDWLPQVLTPLDPARWELSEADEASAGGIAPTPYKP